jgi:hypothetical protein
MRKSLPGTNRSLRSFFFATFPEFLPLLKTPTVGLGRIYKIQVGIDACDTSVPELTVKRDFPKF